MSSPRLGVVRDSMWTNPRIIGAPLGQCRSRGPSGLGPEFTFGISSSVRDGGVAEVLSSWRVQTRPSHSAPHLPPVTDFVSLNRDAVKSGLVTAKELSQYRAQRGGATKYHAHTRPRGSQQEGGASRRPAVPDITFGIQGRPASPLDDLLSHQYGRRWIDEQLSRNRTADRGPPRRIKATSIPETRTSVLRKSTTTTHTDTQRRTHTYTQVAPALDTFRDSSLRLRSFRGHHLDSVSRRGAHGLGAYTLD
ncbi:cilia- and flagella-associated protein 77 [Sphaeramia orbicularis]|uniref:cilia- and flagella-associated protein 77 n=1 Tax=Sphaeramia orbicularis TaxID=375764 RepID=UPI00117CAC95|nr:cilia- and flagella-associated protein 77 [Sphaeramia orbicularis]